MAESLLRRYGTPCSPHQGRGGEMGRSLFRRPLVCVLYVHTDMYIYIYYHGKNNYIRYVNMSSGQRLQSLTEVIRGDAISRNEDPDEATQRRTQQKNTHITAAHTQQINDAHHQLHYILQAYGFNGPKME